MSRSFSSAYLHAVAKLEEKPTWVRRGTECRKCQEIFVACETSEGEPDTCGLCKARAKRPKVQ